VAEQRHATSSWDTPDPRDADAYPSASASLEQLAWEFLRRREDYRKRWAESVRPFLNGNNGFDLALVRRHNADALRRRECWRAPWSALCDEFRVSGNPAVDAARYNITLDPRRAVPPWFEGLGVTTVHNWPAQPTKVQFEIDKTLPIDPQLEQVRQFLHRPEKPHRLQRDKFPRYLRLLDFYEAGTPHKEIGEHLFPDAVGEKLRNSIRDSRAAARQCQDSYLLIALA
jgi:hypothetical protein